MSERYAGEIPVALARSFCLMPALSRWYLSANPILTIYAFMPAYARAELVLDVVS